MGGGFHHPSHGHLPTSLDPEKWYRCPHVWYEALFTPILKLPQVFQNPGTLIVLIPIIDPPESQAPFHFPSVCPSVFGYNACDPTNPYMYPCADVTRLS